MNFVIVCENNHSVFRKKIDLFKDVQQQKLNRSQVKPLKIFGNDKSSQSHITGLPRPDLKCWLRVSKIMNFANLVWF